MAFERIATGILTSLETSASDRHITLVVDDNNQIVYTRGANLPGAGMESPGAFLSCIHAFESPGGCGTTASCAFCGAGEALRLSRERKTPFERECTIHTRNDAGTGGLNYRVYAFPFDVEGSGYVLLDLEDIADRKRREALERVFYHDVLNTATGLRVYLDLLAGELESSDSSTIVATLSEIVNSLVDEINSQRMLTSAEIGTLETQSSLIDGIEIVGQTALFLRGDAKARKVEIAIRDDAEHAAFVSDAAILRRVLFNAIKNAVEASSSGDLVSIGIRQLDTGVEFSIHNDAFISEEVQHQLFKRFYSTKGPNRGLGTYSMMLFTENYLHGEVTIESSETDGTMVRIILPSDLRARASNQR